MNIRMRVYLFRAYLAGCFLVLLNIPFTESQDCSSFREVLVYRPCERQVCVEGGIAHRRCCMFRPRANFFNPRPSSICKCDPEANCYRAVPGLPIGAPAPSFPSILRPVSNEQPSEQPVAQPHLPARPVESPYASDETSPTENSYCSYSFEIENYKHCPMAFCNVPGDITCCKKPRFFYLPPETCLCHPGKSCDVSDLPPPEPERDEKPDVPECQLEEENPDKQDATDADATDDAIVKIPVDIAAGDDTDATAKDASDDDTDATAKDASDDDTDATAKDASDDDTGAIATDVSDDDTEETPVDTAADDDIDATDKDVRGNDSKETPVDTAAGDDTDATSKDTSDDDSKETHDDDNDDATGDKSPDKARKNLKKKASKGSGTGADNKTDKNKDDKGNDDNLGSNEPDKKAKNTGKISDAEPNKKSDKSSKNKEGKGSDKQSKRKPDGGKNNKSDRQTKKSSKKPEKKDDTGKKSDKADDTVDHPSLCSNRLRLLHATEVKNQCKYKGVAKIVRENKEGGKEFSIVCNAVYTIAQVGGAPRYTFLTPRACGQLAQEETEGLALLLQIGDQSYPIPSSRVFSTTDGPNGNWYITPESLYVSWFRDLGGCQSNACPYNPKAMRGQVSFNDCKVVSYGVSDADTFDTDGLREKRISFYPGGCLEQEDFFEADNTLCFRTLDGKNSYCASDAGAPVYCRTFSTKEWILVGTLAFQTNCEMYEDMKVIPFPL